MEKTARHNRHTGTRARAHAQTLVTRNIFTRRWWNPPVPPVLLSSTARRYTSMQVCWLAGWLALSLFLSLPPPLSRRLGHSNNADYPPCCSSTCSRMAIFPTSDRRKPCQRVCLLRDGPKSNSSSTRARTHDHTHTRTHTNTERTHGKRKTPSRARS